MRLGLPLLRGKCRKISCGRNRGNNGEPQLHPLSAAWSGAGGDAMEFSLLASTAIRRAGVDGRERRTSEARIDRSAERAGHRGHFPESGVSRRNFPDTSGGLAKSGQNTGRPAGNGGHIDGKRRSRNGSRNRRGEKN